MSTPQAKRRRLNEATKTLHKPFKSPFRTALQPNTPSSDPPSSDLPEISESAPALSTVAASTLVSHIPKSTLSRLHLSTSNRPTSKKPSPTLTREIIQLRSDIQILSQANRLATTTEDENLLRLIDTWRMASRAAAEELFAGTRDRVNRMGGVGAWRDREKEQKEWRRKQDVEAMEAERERREAEREGEDNQEDERYLEGADDYGEDDQEQQEVSGKDDDSFTMDMMLKTLNIDLKLIGYDKDAQRWEG